MLLVLVFAAGFALKTYVFPPPLPPAVNKIDTLYVRDTEVVERPVMVDNWFAGNIEVMLNDTTIIQSDSVIVLQRESKHYRGESYEAWVSGYRPRLDSLLVFPEKAVITKYVKHKNTIGIGLDLQTLPSLDANLYASYTRHLKVIDVGVESGFNVGRKNWYVTLGVYLPLDF